MKVLDFVKLNEIEIKNELVKRNFIFEDEIDEINFVENFDDKEICGIEDGGIEFSFNKDKMLEGSNFKLKMGDKVLFCSYYDF